MRVNFAGKCFFAGLLLISRVPAVFGAELCEGLPGGQSLACADGDSCESFSGGWRCRPWNDARKAYKPKIIDAKGAAPREMPGNRGGACKGGMSLFKPALSSAMNVQGPDAKIHYYTKALALWSPCDGPETKANAYTGRGSAYYLKGEYDRAVEDYSAAIELNPRDAAPYNNRGDVFYMQKQYRRAIADFDAALRVQPDFNDARKTRDSAYQKLEEEKKGRLQRGRPGWLGRLQNISGKPFNAPARRPSNLPPRIQPDVTPVSLRNTAVAGQTATADTQNAQSFSSWSKPSQSLTSPETPVDRAETGRSKAGKPAENDWILYCVAGFFLPAAIFLCVTYLTFKDDHARIRKELQPLATEMNVDIHWMFFGFFMPPESEFHGKLLISLAIYSALGSLAAGFIFFNFPLDNVIKILAGLLISGTVSCVSVLASYSMKAESVRRDDNSGEVQAGQFPPSFHPDKRPFPGETRNLAGPAAKPEPVKSAEPDATSYRSVQISNLMEAGNYKEALETLSRKTTFKIDDADRARLFEIYIRLGDFSRAGNIFESLKGNRLLTENIQHYENLAVLCHEHGETRLARIIHRGLFEALKASVKADENASLYYNLAAFCEQKEDAELARDIFRCMLDAGLGGYKDVSARYGDLKARLLVTVAQPAQNSAAAGQQFTRSGVSLFGKVLDRKYEIKGELGEGGMATVYEGWDRQMARKVAIKKMHSWLKKYPEEHGRFVQEAKIVSRLQHPNIVGVQAIVEQEDEIYLIFDYVDGKTLSDLLKEKGRLPLQECKDIFKGVCGAVHYAHMSNVIHRDLKLANIMLDKNGNAKVMDFGLASELRESLTRVTHQTTSGTPAYMAPEQYMGIVKRESDIYAMGVCLYEMLTGKLPFTVGDIQKQKNEKEFREVSGMLPWLPSGIDELITRAMEPEPSQRFADPMDFFDALNDL
ncbi:MAG: protein kinase [Elusimicrobia bacterium]|nr:protein kinase [Elusimicrobiota bacterium]